VRNTPSESGFTLLEVAIAISMLGLALVTLIGLQSRITDNYVRERNLTKAALYAQYLMTLIETDTKLPSEGSTDSDLSDALREAGYFEVLDGKERQREMDAINGWHLTRRVTLMGIPPVEDALRRIDLIVSWGPAPGDSFPLVYMIRGAGTAAIAQALGGSQ
jgi:prepilin-type N-terminal cleavage/methylation domain-containing protein